VDRRLGSARCRPGVVADDHERPFVLYTYVASKALADERQEGGAVLAMLDAGLRMGEVAGLMWGQVRWGESEEDPKRALVIDRSRARGREEGPPKSG
jgi:hypothetical protein